MVFHQTFIHFCHLKLYHIVSLVCCISNAFTVLNISTHLTTLLPFGSL